MLSTGEYQPTAEALNPHPSHGTCRRVERVSIRVYISGRMLRASSRPIWQLRVGDWRVLYDVDKAGRVVVVAAVRQKGRKRTEEIL